MYMYLVVCSFRAKIKNVENLLLYLFCINDNLPSIVLLGDIFYIYIQLLFLILLKEEEIMENNMKFLKLKF